MPVGSSAIARPMSPMKMRHTSDVAREHCCHDASGKLLLFERIPLCTLYFPKRVAWPDHVRPPCFAGRLHPRNNSKAGCSSAPEPKILSRRPTRRRITSISSGIFLTPIRSARPAMETTISNSTTCMESPISMPLWIPCPPMLICLFMTRIKSS